MNTGHWRLPAAKDVHFDIDDYINRFIFSSQVHKFPTPIARFLGYRKKPHAPIGNILIAFWAFFGAFVSLVLVGAVFRYSGLNVYHTPVLFASLGATAILDYNVIQSPLAQPRASIFGQGLAAIVGVSVAKLFELNPDFANLRWIAGPLGCGIASFVMTMTNTIHPPGGATALVAVIDPTVQALGWMFIPLIVLSSFLMFLVALVVNNVQRQFPIFWWSAKDVGRKPCDDIESFQMKEKSETKAEQIENVGNFKKEDRLEYKVQQIENMGFRQMIVLSGDRVMLPEGFELDPEQVQVLQVLRDRLRDWNPYDEEDGRRSFGSESEATHVEHGYGHRP